MKTQRSSNSLVKSMSNVVTVHLILAESLHSHGVSKVKVRGSSKSVGYIFMLIHSVIVEIFQSGQKWCTAQMTNQ